MVVPGAKALGTDVPQAKLIGHKGMKRNPSSGYFKTTVSGWNRNLYCEDRIVSDLAGKQKWSMHGKPKNFGTQAIFLGFHAHGEKPGSPFRRAGFFFYELKDCVENLHKPICKSKRTGNG